MGFIAYFEGKKRAFCSRIRKDGYCNENCQHFFRIFFIFCQYADINKHCICFFVLYVTSKEVELFNHLQSSLSEVVH